MTLLLALTVALAGDDDLTPYLDVLPDSPSYTTAVKRMYAAHEGHPVTLYCGCDYAGKTPDLASCGLEAMTGTRWTRTEAEHVVPASVFGATRPCWEEVTSDRRGHCAKTDPVFKAFYGDLHNLRPTVGGINAARSNLLYGIVGGEPRDYGACNFEIDPADDRAEPAPDVRGDVARIWRYVDDLYGLSLSSAQRHVLQAWSREDPVDEWEVALDRLIEERQGNSNPFVR
jgi:deoxyribonuclease-1